jgi:hypothetical protein
MRDSPFRTSGAYRAYRLVLVVPSCRFLQKSRQTVSAAPGGYEMAVKKWTGVIFPTPLDI